MLRRPGPKPEELLAACSFLLRDIDVLLSWDAREPDAEWWSGISTVFRIGLGQDPRVLRQFESARSAFLRARGDSDLRRLALVELRDAVESAAARIARLSEAEPA